MTSDIFLDYPKQFDKCMKTQKRQMLLFIDNAPSHPKDFWLSNVEAVFIPANTTSLLQCLDQGINAAIKKNYRKRLLKAVNTRMDRGGYFEEQQLCHCTGCLLMDGLSCPRS